MPGLLFNSVITHLNYRCRDRSETCLCNDIINININEYPGLMPIEFQMQLQE